MAAFPFTTMVSRREGDALRFVLSLEARCGQDRPLQGFRDGPKTDEDCAVLGRAMPPEFKIRESAAPIEPRHACVVHGRDVARAVVQSETTNAEHDIEGRG